MVDSIFNKDSYQETELQLAQVLATEDRGASLVEYGLLVALIAVVAMGAVRIFGQNLSTSYSQTNSAVAGAVS